MINFDLSGRVILLTGAAGYLGRSMSRAILESGAELIMVGRRESALLAQKNTYSTDLQNHCHIVSCDITDPGTSDFLKVTIEERFGQLHGIINNAYSGKVGTIDNIEAEDIMTACNYNLISPFQIIKALAPLLEKTAKQGKITTSIINVSSMYGSVSPDPDIYSDSGKNNPIHYGASKAGMIQMTRYLACHLGKLGIRVNSISPGAFPDTSLDPGIPDFFDKLKNKVPMKQIGKPQEIAGPIIFLLSEAASYINGANLAVDGGWTAW